VALDSSAAPSSLKTGTRIEALDVLRGLVIVLMALDHVRDYFHESGYAYDPLDPAVATGALYITRWVTHVCAPTFVFLAGVSAWLQGAKGKDPARLASFLLSRGIWLVVLEWTVVGFGWSFSIPFILPFQVIWAIGVSMIVLAMLVRLPSGAVLAIGVAIVAGHNLLDSIRAAQFGSWAWLWQLLHERAPLFWNGAVFGIVVYPVLPWIGVMALGYGLGPVFLSPNRDRSLVRLSLAMAALFVVLRTFNVYGDPVPWAPRGTAGQTAMAFMNVAKYPPSLLYVCATLSPMLLLVPVFDRLRGPWANVLRTFGAVPLMAYVAHLYVMHLVAIAAHAAAGHDIAGMFGTIHHIFFDPKVFAGTSFGLPIVYVGWITVLVIIYPVCRWWADVKRRRRDWWLSYL
jgi:uncharacterized membrane protein